MGIYQEIYEDDDNLEADLEEILADMNSKSDDQQDSSGKSSLFMLGLFQPYLM